MGNEYEWDGKLALVTGGASGIGLAIARALAARGTVPLLVDRDPDALQGALRELRAQGLQVQGFEVDVTGSAAVKGLREQLRAKGLVPDMLINCAGVTLVAHASATDLEEWNRIIGVNLMGTVNVVETFLPDLLERGAGHIVNIGSIDGLVPMPGLSAYCASKFAVTGMSEVLYYDLKSQGIGVTLVCPGYVNTPMSRAHPVKDLPIRFRGWRFVSRLLELFSSSPEKIAARTLKGVEKGRFLVIPGFPSRLMYLYRRFFPRLASSSGVAVARLYDRLRRLHLHRATQAC
ncbi:MAG: SDR family NAD(P)-dependent oxidoreductase [Actinobacteria bacterium]|nr:SDR family NAD(P)-dependent oxidoreductase [Actinomycetota bacterium]